MSHCIIITDHIHLCTTIPALLTRKLRTVITMLHCIIITDHIHLCTTIPALLTRKLRTVIKCYTASLLQIISTYALELPFSLPISLEL
jgi:hypothetical protein